TPRRARSAPAAAVQTSRILLSPSDRFRSSYISPLASFAVALIVGLLAKTLLQRTQRDASELQNAAADRRVPKPFRVKFVNSARHLDPDVDTLGVFNTRCCDTADTLITNRPANSPDESFPTPSRRCAGAGLGVRESDNWPEWNAGPYDARK